MENKCENWVYPTMQGVGKLQKHKCGKVASNEDSNGRKLCHSHYKRWLKKVENINH